MSSNREYMRRYMPERYHRRRSEWIQKLGGICVSCSTDKNLEFDHIDANAKTFSIGRALSGWAESRIEAEMAKCQLLCSRCHLSKSYTMGDILPVATEHGTYAMYRHRLCRCDLCRAANAQHQRDWKANRKATQEALDATFGTLV